MRRLLLTLLLLLVSCSNSAPPAPAATSGSRLPPGTKHRVVYEVLGSAPQVELTYTDRHGNTEQKVVSLPWSQAYDIPAGETASIKAQNGKQGGLVTCEIKVDTVSFKRAKAEGAFKIAKCEGRLP